MIDKKAVERERKAQEAVKARESVQRNIDVHEAFLAKLPTLYEGDLLDRMVKAGTEYVEGLRRSLRE